MRHAALSFDRGLCFGRDHRFYRFGTQLAGRSITAAEGREAAEITGMLDRRCLKKAAQQREADPLLFTYAQYLKEKDCRCFDFH